MVILLVVVGSMALVGVITVALLRFVTRRLGLKEVFEEGLILTDDGLEHLGLHGLGKVKVPYQDVESIEIFRFFQGWMAVTFSHVALWRFGGSSLCIRC